MRWCALVLVLAWLGRECSAFSLSSIRASRHASSTASRTAHSVCTSSSRLACESTIGRKLTHGNRRGTSSLDMSVYSSALGVPAALVEERDACGVGFIARLNNKPCHDIVRQALAALTCMEHRGASSADNVSGDGAGK